MFSWRLSLRAGALLLAFAQPVPAQTILVVDKDGHGTAADCGGAATAFTTIGAAIAAASAGDTVQVCPGTYVENIDFAGKAISVRSTGGAAATIIDGGAAGSVVTFASGETAASVLDGFTLRNGFGGGNRTGITDGSGVRIQNASPTIRNNVITGNHGCSGVGVFVNGGSPLIDGNTISGNVQDACSGGGGAGIAILFASTARIRRNVIRDNIAGAGNGGGLSLFGASGVVIERNTIAGNRAEGGIPCAQGGGIWIVNEANLTIAGNLITGNTAGCGGGIYNAASQSTLLIVNNTVAGNDGAQGSAFFNAAPVPGAAFVNNLLVGMAAQTAVWCGGGFAQNSLRLNDAFSSAAAPYGGVCPDATGVNGNMSGDPMFVDPAGGNYRIRAGSPAVDSGDKTVSGIPSTDFDGAARVVDGDGDGVADVDLGAYEFQGPPPAGGTIAGRVTASGTSAPLSAVTVQIYTSTGAFAKSRATDGAGNFSVGGLAAGTYFVQTSNAGAQGFADELYDNITCLSCAVTGGTPIIVAVGATRSGVNFALAAAGALSGTVADTSNFGLGAITVAVYTAAGLVARRSVTSLTGAFAVNGLPPGNYFARTFVPADRNFVDELYDNLPCAPSCVVTTGAPIAVVAGATRTGVNFALDRAALISGFITDARTHLYVQGVTVAIYSLAGILVKQVLAVTGSYEAVGLPAGTYFARTFVPPSLKYSNQLFDHLACDSDCLVTTGTPIVLTAGGGRVDVNFSLVPLTNTIVPGRSAAFALADSADVQWTSMEMVEGRSYCGQVSSAATAINRATPKIDVYTPDGMTAIALGSGGRACFEAPGAGTALFRISQTEPSARPYRLSVVETTLWANWFYIGGDFSSFILLRNTTNEAVHVTITARDGAGDAVGEADGYIPPNAVAFLDAAPLRDFTSYGSIDVAHDGEPQAIIGSQTTLSPTAGLSFDTVMMQRGRR